MQLYENYLDLLHFYLFIFTLFLNKNISGFDLSMFLFKNCCSCYTMKQKKGYSNCNLSLIFSYYSLSRKHNSVGYPDGYEEEHQM